MASIRERNGSYQISVYVGEDMKGNKLFERTTFRPTQTTPKAIKNEVNDFAREFEKRVKEGKYLTGDKLTLSRFVEIWTEEWAIKNLTTVGLEDYQRLLNGRVLDKLGNMKLSKITALHIQSVYDELEKGGLAPATIRKTNTALNSVFKYAFRMGTIKENPCERIELPRMKRNKDIHFFTVTQAKAFLEALEDDHVFTCSSSDRKIKNTGTEFEVREYTAHRTVSFQFRVLFSLAIYGGFRRGEIVALKWSDIDFEADTVSITKAVTVVDGQQTTKAPKTKTSRRVVSIPHFLTQRLKALKHEQLKYRLSIGDYWQGDNWVFIQVNGKQMSYSTPYSAFHDTLVRYNASHPVADHLPLIPFHGLRHTSATLMIAGQLDVRTVSSRLGHAQASTTMNIYAHALQETDRKAANALEDMLIKHA